MDRRRVCWVLPLVLASTGTAWAADTELRVYGGVDVSIDYVNTGLQNMAQAASNGSYVGVGGSSQFNPDWKVVAQIEAGADIAATPSFNGAWGARNSFVGFSSQTWGSIKVGKNDTPYKSSTAAFDPFANTIGDYNSIVSNTGGDSRVEFEYRAPHAVWYESPNFGPVNFNFMWGFGQNRAGDGSDFPVGDNTCEGGSFGSSGSGNAGTQNNFGSTSPNANPPHQPAVGPLGGVNTGFASNVRGSSTIGSGFGECTDGGFNGLFSASIIFKKSNFIAIGAFEYHHSVNRLADVVPFSGIPNDLANPALPLISTANEYAGKVGAGYDFGVVKAYLIYEMLRRTVTPDDFNERSRDGIYASVTWRVTDKDDISFAYNHAFSTPGNPLTNSTVNFSSTSPIQGQQCPQTANPATSTPNGNDDSADQFSTGIRHYFNPAVSVYAVTSLMHNHACGHFVLGSGGHGAPVTQRNQFNETFVGKDLAGISVGTTFRF